MNFPISDLVQSHLEPLCPLLGSILRIFGNGLDFRTPRLRIPLTPVGPEDGCMHVVPSAFDELFDSSDPKHLRPETPETPETHGEALSCKAGEAGSGLEN